MYFQKLILEERLAGLGAENEYLRHEIAKLGRQVRGQNMVVDSRLEENAKLRSEIAELKTKNKEFNLQNLPFMSLASLARCHEELSDYYIKRVDNAKRVSESIKNRESFVSGEPLFKYSEKAKAFFATGGLVTPYSRQEVLSEKWKPTGECFSIGIAGVIGFIYAPTEELVEEIISIRKGEWLPKKGDDIFTMYGDVIKGENCNRNMIYFPTPEQRTAFIEKNQPKEYISKGIGSVKFTGGNSYGGVEITVTVKDK